MPDAPLCAYCRQRPVDPAHRPFCSERCRTIDLGRWLTGSYRVASEPTAEEPVEIGESDDDPAGGRDK